MEKTSEEPEWGSPLASIYDISGEPAVVIDGMPSVAQSDVSVTHFDAPSSAKRDNDPGFGEWLEGRAVQKLFEDHLYSGRVTKFDKETGWYRVDYEDGDFEDLEWNELEEILAPLDITVPLKTLALKMLKKKATPVRAKNQSSSRLHPSVGTKHNTGERLHKIKSKIRDNRSAEFGSTSQ